MRKTLVIALVAVHLLGNTEFSQLAKLPALLTHFFQHQQLDPSITFSRFLYMHYLGNDGTASDDHEDSKLPCHNGHSYSLTVQFAPLVKETPVSSDRFPEADKIYRNRSIYQRTTKHAQKVLQPPRPLSVIA